MHPNRIFIYLSYTNKKKEKNRKGTEKLDDTEAERSGPERERVICHWAPRSPVDFVLKTLNRRILPFISSSQGWAVLVRGIHYFLCPISETWSSNWCCLEPSTFRRSSTRGTLAVLATPSSCTRQVKLSCANLFIFPPPLPSYFAFTRLKRGLQLLLMRTKSIN